MKFARIHEARLPVGGTRGAISGTGAAQFGGARKVRGVGSELLVLDSHLSYP